VARVAARRTNRSRRKESIFAGRCCSRRDAGGRHCGVADRVKKRARTKSGQPGGKPNRTTGAFATSYKARVLPISVRGGRSRRCGKRFPGRRVSVGELFGGQRRSESDKGSNTIEKTNAGKLFESTSAIRDLPDSKGPNGRAGCRQGSFPGPSLGVLLVKLRSGNRA